MTFAVILAAVLLALLALALYAHHDWTRARRRRVELAARYTPAPLAVPDVRNYRALR